MPARPQRRAPGLALLLSAALLLLPSLARADDGSPDATGERAHAERVGARRTRAIWAGIAVITIVIALLGRAFGRAQRARDRERRRTIDAQARAWLAAPAESLGTVEEEAPDAPARAAPGPVGRPPSAAAPDAPAAVVPLLAALAGDPAALATWRGRRVQGEGLASFTSAVLGRDGELGVDHGVRVTVEVEVPGSGPFPPRVVLHLAAPPAPDLGFHEAVRFSGVAHGYQEAGRTLLLRDGAITR